jgi:carbonic anhydrase
MKYAKVVVFGQLALAVVLVGAFMLKSKAASSAGHGEPEAAVVATASGHGAGGDKDKDKAKAGDKAGAHGHGEAGKGDPKKAGDKGDKGDKGDGHDDGAGDKEHGAAGAPALGKEPKAIAKALLAGNARFLAGDGAHVDLLQQVAVSKDGQHPGAMVLGCADSRVPPELIFDRGIGELFVVRSAGNIAEPVSTGSLEYAVEHLHAKVLVVLGHEKCGAVQAALADGKLPTPNLEALVEHIAPAVKGLKAWAEGPDLVRLAVEANVRHQANELLRRSKLLRQAVAAGEVTILKAVYDLETGRIRPI